jgi:hypothetical protein
MKISAATQNAIIAGITSGAFLVSVKLIEEPAPKWVGANGALTLTMVIIARANAGKTTAWAVVGHILAWAFLVGVLLGGDNPQPGAAVTAQIVGTFCTLAVIGRRHPASAVLPPRDEFDWPGKPLGTAIEAIRPGDLVSVVQDPGGKTYVQKARAEDFTE